MYTTVEQNSKHSVYESPASDCQKKKLQIVKGGVGMNPVVLGWNQKYQYELVFFKCVQIDI